MNNMSFFMLKMSLENYYIRPCHMYGEEMKFLINIYGDNMKSIPALLVVGGVLFSFGSHAEDLSKMIKNGNYVSYQNIKDDNLKSMYILTGNGGPGGNGGNGGHGSHAHGGNGGNGGNGGHDGNGSHNSASHGGTGNGNGNHSGNSSSSHGKASSSHGKTSHGSRGHRGGRH